MTRLNKTLWTLAVLFVLLAIFALWSRTYLQEQLRSTTNDPEQIRQFFSQPAQPSEFAAPSEPCSNYQPERQALFGGLHIHTSASYDAGAFGVTNTVDDAYRFARGEKLQYRLDSDPADAQVPLIQLERPLDFAAVTDHAGKLGERLICYDPSSAGYDSMICNIYRGDWQLPLGEAMTPLVKLASQAIFTTERSLKVCGPGGGDCRAAAVEAWRDNQRATEHWQSRDSDCQFTSFHGYEYTLAADGANLHRNVIFASSNVPRAVVSAADMNTPEQLLQWLNDSCIEGNEDCDVLTIPHNSNWSSGRMWFPYSMREDLDQDRRRHFAGLRNNIERLVEIMQVKGDSECRNGLSSVYGVADELCDFEKLRSPAEEIFDCGDEMGSGNMRLSGCLSRFSYARYALPNGQAEAKRLGVNPFKLGIVAATDNHNATATADTENNYMGANGPDRVARNRLRGDVEVPGGIAKGSPVRYGPGGVAGVWAEENSRASIFAAMKRRETFGTSGPRITPRFFGGWQLDTELCQSTKMVEDAYKQAVPMGSDLPGRPAGEAPSFLVSASQDPLSNPLQQLQVIKGWVDVEGKTWQKIYEVAGNSSNGASVDLNSCQPRGSGFAQLCSVWQDPDFDPTQDAVYYSRVVENPSCRWSTWQCNAIPESERPESCHYEDLPKTIQERAWTSPIWYSAAASQ